jgi:hypothetical protein
MKQINLFGLSLLTDKKYFVDLLNGHTVFLIKCISKLKDPLKIKIFWELMFVNFLIMWIKWLNFAKKIKIHVC